MKLSIQILLQKDKIIFGDDKLDITEEILKIFNDKHKKIKEVLKNKLIVPFRFEKTGSQIIYFSHD